MSPNHRATARLIGNHLTVKPAGYDPKFTIALVDAETGASIAHAFRHNARQIKSPGWLESAARVARNLRNPGCYETDGPFVHIYEVNILRPFANITRVTLLKQDFAMPHTLLCDSCAGSGMDDNHGACHACGGSGRVELTDAQLAALHAQLARDDLEDA